MSEANIPRPASTFFERVRIKGNPIAHPEAVVISGSARFTVLTSRLIRLEWTQEGKGFEDRGSFAFPTRYANTPPTYSVRREEGWLVIDTGKLMVRYQENSGAFRPENLTISFELEGKNSSWQPGTPSLGNLRGTRRTLDECSGDVALEEGLISRDGWSVYDDSQHVLFNPVTGWVEPRINRDLQDWYFFGYGHDYKAALKEYTFFGGEIPLIPRYVLGAWWSRYWAYSDKELMQIVKDFAHYDFPLDVLVVDMDWHTEDSWTGYTWNRKLFPDPKGFLQWVHEQGLRTTLNLHPAEGVQAFEEVYPTFSQALGQDPTSREPVPFRITDQKFVEQYFALLHHPLEDDGVDFWWMDWQQGSSSEMPGLDPLPWLNHLHFLDSTRRGARAMLYSRWGGLGNHRYHIGFSGDTYSVWEALQFQPYFTATASNVCYGWWSHDIGGHMYGVEPELFARWVQFGALSPCLRLHATKNALAERRPWLFPMEVQQATRQAFHLRYQLIPYLYSVARSAMESGLSLSRPMYYEYPAEEAAYVARYQYYLGDQLIAAPIVFPSDPVTGLAHTDVWLPEGEWIDFQTKEFFTGPRWIRITGGIDRIPLMVKAGSIIPMSPIASTTDQLPKDRLVLHLFPGKNGHFRLYEDDGLTEAYHLKEEFEWTDITLNISSPESLELRIAPVTGNCPALPEARSYELYFEGINKPESITLNAQPITEWRYESQTLSAVLTLPPYSKKEELVISLKAKGGETISRLGSEHNQELQLVELKQMLGSRTPATSWDKLSEALLSEPVPGQKDVVARLGGPFAYYLEYTTPEEARRALGALVVAPPQDDKESCELEVTWRLHKDGKVMEFHNQLETINHSQVIYSPFKIDKVENATFWEAEATIVWRGHKLSYIHKSKTLFPTVSGWYSVVYNEAEENLTPASLFDEKGEPLEKLPWRSHVEEFEVDKSLSNPYYMRLREWYEKDLAKGTPLAGYAVSTITSPDEKEVVFQWRSPGPFKLWLNGQEIEDMGLVKGTSGEGTVFPVVVDISTSGPIKLQAGRNTLVAFTKSPEGRPYWWLGVAILNPDGTAVTDLSVNRNWIETP